jgi:hypothetical protein
VCFTVRQIARRSSSASSQPYWRWRYSSGLCSRGAGLSWASSERSSSCLRSGVASVRRRGPAGCAGRGRGTTTGAKQREALPFCVVVEALVEQGAVPLGGLAPSPSWGRNSFVHASADAPGRGTQAGRPELSWPAARGKDRRFGVQRTTDCRSCGLLGWMTTHPSTGSSPTSELSMSVWRACVACPLSHPGLAPATLASPSHPGRRLLPSASLGAARRVALARTAQPPAAPSDRPGPEPSRDRISPARPAPGQLGPRRARLGSTRAPPGAPGQLRPRQARPRQARSGQAPCRPGPVQARPRAGPARPQCPAAN